MNVGNIMNSNADRRLIVAYAIAVLCGIVMIVSVLANVFVVEMIKSQFHPFRGYAPIPDVFNYLRYTMLAVAASFYFLIRYVNNKVLSSPLVRSLGLLKLIAGALAVYVLCLFVAIHGLVLFLVQGSSIDFYMFLIISLCYFAVFFPKYSKWKVWLTEHEIFMP